MKKFVVFVACICVFGACINSVSPSVVNSKDLEGRYEIDMSSVLTDHDKRGFTGFISALMLSDLKFTMQFDDGKLIVDGTGTVLKLLGEQFIGAFDYEIRNDSVVYLRNDKSEFRKAFVIRKIGNSYDYLQMVTENDGRVFNMRRL